MALDLGDGPDLDDDDEVTCADCRIAGGICRPCHDDEYAERAAERRADRDDDMWED